MIELGNILIRDNISLVEARNKIRFLGQDLKYSSMSIIQLTTITSEIIRSIGPTEKEEVRMIVGFEEKETKYGLVLQFQSKKREINLSLIKTFFDKVQILPLKNGLQRIITFKHIPDSTFRPTDEFIEEEKERIIRFSRAELLSEVEKKNEELLKLLDERKKAEKTLRHSQQEFASLFKNSPEALVYLDKNSIIVNINPRFTKLFGYTLEEIKGRNINDGMIHPPDKIEEGGKLDEIALSKAYFSYEGIRKKKDGTSFPVSIASSNIKIDGQLKGALVIYIDITERKQAEENVKNAKDELEMLLDSVPAIIFYKDIEGRIIRANKTLANSLKISIKDIVGRTTEELFPKEEAENMRKDDQEVIISGKPKRDIIQPYDTPEGTRWAITDKIPYKDKEGKITGIISLSKDITVQRKSEQELQQTYQRLQKTMDATIETVSKIVEVKDPYTAGHQQRVSQLATAIAKELNLSEDKIEGIRVASLIHDIGKISIPTEILSKSTTLSDIEFSLIKEHSRIGYDILKAIDFSYPVANIVLQHHERLNGSGYPQGLKGDKILLEAKIIGVADVVEAMSSHRPYRPALGIDAALEEISQNKGILYDPEVVDACLKLFKEKEFKFES